MTVIGDKVHVNLRTPIQDFYAGQNVLITGGTGFLGKMLIEKLLRSCPDVASIYILVRSKKGKDVHNRMENIFNDPVFNRLKEEFPKFRHRIIAIPGDCSLPGLGLSVADRDLLVREISTVFNVAATVRFDEKLRQAVAINVSGTKEILVLSRCMNNLKAVIHVSTAYSNCTQKDIEEKFYEAPITGDNVMKLTASLDDDKLDAITPTLLGAYPNTYAYTKAIAEQVVQEYGKDLPIGMYRPAIVISSFAEPVEGWIDNIYGPTGAIVGAGAGLIRTLNLDVNCTAELVPVDFAVNALISMAWDVAINKNEEADPPIYNYHSSWNDKLTWGKYMELAFNNGKKIPSMKSMWCYTVTVTKNSYFYFLLTLILHILPALIIDIGFFVTGHEIRMLKVYKKIHKFATVTTYFSTNNWTFHNDNTRTLWDKLTPEDKRTFFFSMKDFPWGDYMKKCVTGLRVHIFKDELNTVPAARKRMARIVFLHRLIKYSAIALAMWFLYLVICFVLSIGTAKGFQSVSRIKRSEDDSELFPFIEMLK